MRIRNLSKRFWPIYEVARLFRHRSCVFESRIHRYEKRDRRSLFRYCPFYAARSILEKPLPFLWQKIIVDQRDPVGRRRVSFVHQTAGRWKIQMAKKQRRSFSFKCPAAKMASGRAGHRAEMLDQKESCQQGFMIHKMLYIKEKAYYFYLVCGIIELWKRKRNRLLKWIVTSSKK